MSDEIAAQTTALDPRFRIASDNPECFLCGKVVRREVAVTVETQASIGMHAHAECANNMPVIELYDRLWKALRAAMKGERETPNPGRAVAKGRFQ